MNFTSCNRISAFSLFFFTLAVLSFKHLYEKSPPEPIRLPATDSQSGPHAARAGCGADRSDRKQVGQI